MALKRKELLKEVNRMQRVLGRQEILHIPDYWQVFYEVNEYNKVKGFAILYQYLRLPIKNEYMTGRTAELTVFTFPEYRHQQVCTRLVKKAISYAKMWNLDIVADSNGDSYELLKRLKFKDVNEHRIWQHLSH